MHLAVHSLVCWSWVYYLRDSAGQAVLSDTAGICAKLRLIFSSLAVSIALQWRVKESRLCMYQLVRRTLQTDSVHEHCFWKFVSQLTRSVVWFLGSNRNTTGQSTAELQHRPWDPSQLQALFTHLCPHQTSVEFYLSCPISASIPITFKHTVPELECGVLGCPRSTKEQKPSLCAWSGMSP